MTDEIKVGDRFQQVSMPHIVWVTMSMRATTIRDEWNIVCEAEGRKDWAPASWLLNHCRRLPTEQVVEIKEGARYRNNLAKTKDVFLIVRKHESEQLSAWWMCKERDPEDETWASESWIKGQITNGFWVAEPLVFIEPIKPGDRFRNWGSGAVWVMIEKVSRLDWRAHPDGDATQFRTFNVKYLLNKEMWKQLPVAAAKEEIKPGDRFKNPRGVIYVIARPHEQQAHRWWARMEGNAADPSDEYYGDVDYFLKQCTRLPPKAEVVALTAPPAPRARSTEDINRELADKEHEDLRRLANSEVENTSARAAMMAQLQAPLPVQVQLHGQLRSRR